jgi:hypothetical protein
MRVDEVEILHRARRLKHLRLIEHGEGMMGDGGTRNQRSGDCRESEGFLGSHDFRSVKNDAVT